MEKQREGLEVDVAGLLFVLSLLLERGRSLRGRGFFQVGRERRRRRQPSKSLRAPAWIRELARRPQRAQPRLRNRVSLEDDDRLFD